MKGTWFGMAAALAVSAICSRSEATWQNGYWVNTPWSNGFWVNGGGFVTTTETGGYMPGASSFTAGIADGVRVGGLWKDGQPIHAFLLGSEIVAWVENRECPEAGRPEAPCFPMPSGGWEQFHRGDWFNGATIEVAALPFIDDVVPVCVVAQNHNIRRDDERDALAVVVRIDDYQMSAAGVASYTLWIDGRDKGTTRPFCAAGRAIPLQGAWNLFPDPDGGGAWRDEGPDRVTFACTSGALGKCVDKGYHPWAPPAPVTNIFGVVETADPRELHQACTRMVRADYCGTGESFTAEGTSIEVGDRFGWTPMTSGLQVRWGVPGESSDPLPPGETSWDGEAYWDGQGALALQCDRYAELGTRVSPDRCPSLARLEQRCPTVLDDQWMSTNKHGTFRALFVNAHRPMCADWRDVVWDLGPPPSSETLAAALGLTASSDLGTGPIQDLLE